MYCRQPYCIVSRCSRKPDDCFLSGLDTSKIRKQTTAEAVAGIKVFYCAVAYKLKFLTDAQAVLLTQAG